MDLMQLRRNMMGVIAMAGSGNIPSFFNHFEYGDLNIDTANAWIQLSDITLPKGILVFSHDFDLNTNAKANKPKLGAYCALYIAGTDTLTVGSSGYYNLAYGAFYVVNWGQNTDNMNPLSRSSRTESRGVPYYNPTNKKFYIHGFGTGEYDFKNDVTYHWIAWD